MPFMKGFHPVRRTLQHLNDTKLILKPFVRIVSVNYNNKGGNSEGARQFVYWHLTQLQYKNPDVQVITFRDTTPSPFIRVFFNSGRDLLMDIDRQTKDQIQERLVRTLCKTKEELDEEAKSAEVKQNPASFGYGCSRHCLCEIPGQVPCPAVVPLPYHMRGRYRLGFAEIDESLYL
ncbi:probable 28S ribosomal protein S25, mitochondrial [Folsomia candida]|uniref:probable 28S ribosomal protein S25, mitochondrial n=1 Tax=Folsomia candida TaxID=158441 RepID=UPI000B908365|nr:probable 28S ribosomal protein S25, mitochondrial [Folsomia candida]XP_021946434.1 probable 28S ribosomal protein S25, mitochondrial [Folsomia candida]